MLTLTTHELYLHRPVRGSVVHLVVKPRAGQNTTHWCVLVLDPSDATRLGDLLVGLQGFEFTSTNGRTVKYERGNLQMHSGTYKFNFSEFVLHMTDFDMLYLGFCLRNAFPKKEG